MPTLSAETAFTEIGSVTLAALLHLIRLMGAELVFRDGCDTERFEKAVAAKFDQFVAPTNNSDARDTGMALARQFVEPVLNQIKAQAELRKSLANTHQQSATAPAGAVPSRTSKLLN